jgi:predicted HAD superfamily Cof-like phosphohydrolase
MLPMPNLSLIKPPPPIELPDVSMLIPVQQEFHQTFSIPITPESVRLYLTLIEEEHEEWVEDFFSEDTPAHYELKELADLLYVTSGYALQLGYDDIKPVQYKIHDSWDWAITELVGDIAGGNSSKQVLGQLIYCLFGYANYMSWDLHEAYRRVHASNMSKLTVDGKVLRREDGKVQKSNEYKEPYLEDLIPDRGYSHNEGN